MLLNLEYPTLAQKGEQEITLHLKEMERSFRFTSYIYQVAVSEKKSYIAVGVQDGVVHILRMHNEEDTSHYWIVHTRCNFMRGLCVNEAADMIMVLSGDDEFIVFSRDIDSCWNEERVYSGRRLGMGTMMDVRTLAECYDVLHPSGELALFRLNNEEGEPVMHFVRRKKWFRRSYYWIARDRS